MNPSRRLPATLSSAQQVQPSQGSIVPRVTISILTYKALAQARQCIESVFRNTTDFVLHLTANGSPEAAEYFRSLEAMDSRVRVTVNEKNQGFWRPHNAAFSESTTEFFVALNDDTIVPPGWIEALYAPFERDPKAAITGPLGGCSELMSDFNGRRGAQEYVEGACIMVRSSVAREHGLFNKRLPGLAYGEDSELSLRYRQLGYNLHWVSMGLLHVRGATSRHVPEAAEWQKQNHGFLKRKFGHYILVRKFGYPIVVRRNAAWGDVLLTTSIIRSIKKRSPQSPIHVETMLPDIFVNNPYVSTASRKVRISNDAQVYDLNMAYENRPMTHIVEAYRQVVDLDPEEMDGTHAELFPSQGDEEWADRTLPVDRWVAIHAGPSTWPNKQWPVDRFVELAEMIRDSGAKVVLVGGPSSFQVPHDLDMRAKTNPVQLAALIGRCDSAVCIDSFPMHVAQSVDIPVVGLFGVTLPDFIVQPSPRFEAVCSDPSHPASGARHKIAGATAVKTEGNPLDTVTINQVYAAWERVSVVRA